MKNSNEQNIGVCAIIINSNGKILLGKRKNCYKAGYYGLPGGHVEVNEPLKTAIIREVKEETGMELDTLEYVGVIRENQGEYDFIHFVYVAIDVVQKPELCEPDKCEGWQWVGLSTFEEEILPGHLAAVKMYQEKEVLRDIVH